MDILNKKSTKRPFLERVAMFDLDRYYTPGVRFLCHLSMWIVFTTLLQLNLFLDSGLPFDQAAAFTGRTLVCNIIVFYLFFYVAVPNTLLKGKVITTIISFIVCIYLWILFNHYILIFISQHFKVMSPYYTRGLKSNQQESFWYVISPRNFLILFMPVFYSISPFFFTKIVFSIIRFYSESFKSEIKAFKLERDFLKSQLNPHFLFNTLNSIYALSLRKDDKAPQIITHLSEMMRYTLYESDAQLVSLEKELNYINNYIKLERTRYKQDVKIVCEIDDSHVNGHLIAPLLTFTFIENAFKYGLKDRNNGFICLKISMENDTFKFLISNDNTTESKETEFGGIGLQNAKKRLQLLYPGQHSLSIKDEVDTFTVELSIKLN
ncbi:MAG: sensor histidine kinase [Ginsengibacter sp.]